MGIFKEKSGLRLISKKISRRLKLKLECFSTIQAVNPSNPRGKSSWVIVNRSEKQSKKNFQKREITATIKQFNPGHEHFKKQPTMKKNSFFINSSLSYLKKGDYF